MTKRFPVQFVLLQSKMWHEIHTLMSCATFNECEAWKKKIVAWTYEHGNSIGSSSSHGNDENDSTQIHIKPILL